MRAAALGSLRQWPRGGAPLAWPSVERAAAAAPRCGPRTRAGPRPLPDQHTGAAQRGERGRGSEFLLYPPLPSPRRRSQVDAAFHDPTALPGDPCPLRLLKWLRDGAAGGGGAAGAPNTLRMSLADRASALLLSAPLLLAGGAPSQQQLPTQPAKRPSLP